MSEQLHGGRSAAAPPWGPVGDQRLQALHRRILGAVRGVCPGWLTNDLEDVAQNAMIRVVEILERQGDRNRELPASYLWKTAYSATVDAIRSRRTSRQSEVRLDDTEAGPVVRERAPDPERATAGHEITRGVEDCLGRLVRPRRLAATLYLQGHSVPEISRLLHWTAAKANNLVYRGIADLRRCLESKGMRP